MTNATEAVQSKPGGSYIITGGAGGIGKEVAGKLSPTASRIFLLDRDPNALEDVAARLQHEGSSEIHQVPCDVTDGQSVEHAFEDVQSRTDQLDGLVTSAGIRMTFSNLADLDVSTWQRIMDINVTGVFLCVREFMRAAQQTGDPGSIVTLGSLSGTSARPGWSAYCASKASVLHLTRVAALEGAETGVRANAVCPGTVETDMFLEAQRNDGPGVLKERLYGTPQKMRAGVPMRRLCRPGEVAELICFLLSPASGYITAQAIHIDGGESAI